MARNNYESIPSSYPEDETALLGNDNSIALRPKIDFRKRIASIVVLVASVACITFLTTFKGSNQSTFQTNNLPEATTSFSEVIGNTFPLLTSQWSECFPIHSSAPILPCFPHLFSLIFPQLVFHQQGSQAAAQPMRLFGLAHSGQNLLQAHQPHLQKLWNQEGLGLRDQRRVNHPAQQGQLL